MAVMTMMTTVPKELLDALAKSLPFLFFFLDNLLDFEQVMVMLNLFLTVLAKAELRAGRALIPDTNDRFHEAALALNPFMN